ncbi:MAG TPA: hypothetical protein DDZ51_01200 [Planctomycetaceae bacterium]|nr:hypothetical protein [Planctomycetaceae bacterium]
MARLGHWIVSGAIDLTSESRSGVSGSVQDRPPRACGGLTLINILSSFGIERTVLDVWPHISRHGLRGELCARSYLIGKYAADAGLASAVIQCHAARAWDAVRFCASNGLRLMINHRATNDACLSTSQEGHYTILRSILNDRIELEDPLLGRVIRLCKRDFLDLWQPNLETVGFILIAIGTEHPSDDGNVKGELRCPRCTMPIRFQPSILFEPCHWNQGGMFQRFFCLGCDAAFQKAPNIAP